MKLVCEFVFDLLQKRGVFIRKKQEKEKEKEEEDML